MPKSQKAFRICTQTKCKYFTLSGNGANINQQALKDRLHSIAQEKNITFNDCWKRLLFERFLSRLSQSKHADKFILKGGFLLSCYLELRRETKDLDFSLKELNIREQIQSAINDIIDEKLDDGFTFSIKKLIRLETPDMPYSGFRIALEVLFDGMRDTIQIDVVPDDKANSRDYKLILSHYRGKPLFEREISLLVYPPETIFAEKLVTMVKKGENNTRMKDFHDILLLIREPKSINKRALKESISQTFQNNNLAFQAIELEETKLVQLQVFWTNHLSELQDVGHTLDLPTGISSVIKEINTYIMEL